MAASSPHTWAARRHGECGAEAACYRVTYSVLYCPVLYGEFSEGRTLHSPSSFGMAHSGVAKR